MGIFGAPSSTLGRDRLMCPLTFLYGIQCSTTLIWSLFEYNAYFWQHWALKPIYFPIFVPYMSMMAIFGTPSSTPGGDRLMRPLTFLYGIQCLTTFILNIFGSIVYFWQCRGLKWIYITIFLFLCLHFLLVLKVATVSFTLTRGLLI